jgi:hypothetical protein
VVRNAISVGENALQKLSVVPNAVPHTDSAIGGFARHD